MMEFVFRFRVVFLAAIEQSAEKLRDEVPLGERE